MPRIAVCCNRCNDHLVWDEGLNNDEVKRFIATHENHAGGVMVGEETDTPNVFNFEAEIRLPS